MIDEFQQLEESILFGSDADECEVAGEDLAKLCEQYQQFVESLPEWFDCSRDCLMDGDPYEQFAHDYIMTRMGHGCGFWETDDWSYESGKMLTDMCRQQGTLETYKDDGYLYIV